MKAQMERWEWLPLLGLVASVFIFNTSEFMPIGLLVDIAEDFGITEAKAGMLITAYAWAVTILSLPLMILASRFEYKRLLMGTVLLFGAGQILSAVAGGYWTLMFARLLVACAHSVFWSIATPLAVRIVAKSHGAAALGMIVTGTSLAIICGLPLGRVVGLYVGWRITFGLLGAAALLVLVYIGWIFPRVDSDEPFSLKELPGLLKNPMLTGLYLLTFIHVTGYYTGYSYIEPFLQQVAHMTDGWITAMLVVLGVAGIIGSMLFSRMFNTHPTAFLRTAVLVAALSLFMLRPGAVSNYTMLAVCIIWGIAVTAFNVAGNAEIIRAVPFHASAVATAIFSGIFNLGIGTGTWVGGMVTTYLTIADIGFVGGIFGLIGASYCAFVLSRHLNAIGGKL